MQSILPWIGIVILFLTGWAVVKKYQVNMVLLLGGLALNILAVAGGLTSFLPKNVAATGFVGFDFMELLRAISRTQIAGVGFIILVSGGFAEYMKAIGASDRFVTVCAKPLSLIKNPYLILAAVFIFGHCLGLIITSAAGLAMLMVVTVYPLIIRVGCSSLAAAAVVASVLAIGYAPASGVAVMAAELVHLDPIQYLVQYQLPMAVPTILAMAVAHVVVQYWFDKHDNIKGETADLQELEEKRKVLENVPAIYAVLPIIPIVLLLIFNKMVYQSITLINTILMPLAMAILASRLWDVEVKGCTPKLLYTLQSRRSLFAAKAVLGLAEIFLIVTLEAAGAPLIGHLQHYTQPYPTAGPIGVRPRHSAALDRARAPLKQNLPNNHPHELKGASA